MHQSFFPIIPSKKRLALCLGGTIFLFLFLSPPKSLSKGLSPKKETKTIYLNIGTDSLGTFVHNLGNRLCQGLEQQIIQKGTPAPFFCSAVPMDSMGNPVEALSHHRIDIALLPLQSLFLLGKESKKAFKNVFLLSGLNNTFLVSITHSKSHPLWDIAFTPFLHHYVFSNKTNSTFKVFKNKKTKEMPFFAIWSLFRERKVGTLLFLSSRHDPFFRSFGNTFPFIYQKLSLRSLGDSLVFPTPISLPPLSLPQQKATLVLYSAPLVLLTTKKLPPAWGAKIIQILHTLYPSQDFLSPRDIFSYLPEIKTFSLTS